MQKQTSRLNLNKVNLAVSSKSKLCGGEVIAGGGTNPRRTNQHPIRDKLIKPRQLQNLVPQEWRTVTESATTIRNSTTTLSSVEQPLSTACGYEEQVKMAGDIRNLDGKKQRRHWTLRDRASMSVHFLKANMAEDGCEEAQLDVAKKLIQDSNDPELLESAQKENARLAIYWLVKSSEQGNVAATALLKEFMTSGHGMTAQNILDAQSCINTPTNDKLTYKAARLLYLKLNNGEKFITTTQLLSRIYSLKKSVHFAEESQEDSNPESLSSTVNDKEEEDDMPDVGLNETFTYTPPKSPRVSDTASDLDKPQDLDLEFNQLHLSQSGEKLTVDDLLKAASDFNSGKSPEPAISSTHKVMKRHYWKFWSHSNTFFLQLLIFATLSGRISVNYGVILGAAFLSFWGSFNLLGWKKQHLNFKDWSNAFGSIPHEKYTWSDKDAEGRLLCNSLIPCLTAILASLLLISMVDGLVTLKLVTGVLVVYSLLCGATFTKMSVLRIVLFITTFNVPIFGSLIVDKIDAWNLDRRMFLDLVGSTKDFVSSVFDSAFVNDYFVQVCQAIVIITLVVGSRKNVLQQNLPQLLVALWITNILKFSIQLQNDVLDVGIGLLTIATIITIVSIIQSKMTSWKVLISSTAILVVGVAFAALISSSMEQNIFHKAISSLRSQNTLGQVSVQEIHDVAQLPLLDWDEYDMHCHRKAWKYSTPAYTQLSCFSKYGKTPTAVLWRGRVSIVKIQEIKSNLFQSMDDIVFEIIVSILSPQARKDGTSWQNFLPGSEPTELPSPATLFVSTTKVFDESVKQKLIDFVISLKVGDKIEFHGVLSSATVGSPRPDIEHIQRIKCLECAMAQESTTLFFHQKHLPMTATYDHSSRAGESYNSFLNEVKAALSKLFTCLKSHIV